MAEEGIDKLKYIHQKYDIKRTSYKEEDLESLRLLIEPYFQSDEENRQNTAFLKRFLRAFLTPDESYQAILRYLEWREKFQVNSLSQHDPDIVKEDNIGRVTILEERDSHGRPTALVNVKLHDPATRDMHSLTNYTIYTLEQLASKCNEEIIDNFCTIFDLNGFSLRNMDYTYVKRLIWILQNCYPERLGVCLIVNSPWLFYGCWSIIKLWINEVTASKIIFIQKPEDMNDFIDMNKFSRKLF